MSTYSMTRLGERYELTDLLGQGGMADVYRATDHKLQRQVALKLLRTTTTGDAERERFLGEGRILASLSHPALVTLLDVGTDADRPYLVMELVDGRTLADLVGERRAPDDVARMGAELADALASAHAAGVVHRDVKPGNVLVRDDGRVALFDFGIAKLAGDTRPHTAPGLSVGTAAYLAPEQVQGTDVGPAADVYALGLVLLELLSGVRAYPGPPTEAALARLHRSPEIPDWLPVGWQRLLRQMTASEPVVRPPAASVASLLRSLPHGGVVPAELPDVTSAVPLVGAATASPAAARSLFTWGRALKVLAIAALAIVLTGAVVLARQEPGPRAQDRAGIPDVAPSLQVLLEDLHSSLEPFEERALVVAALERVDRALVDARYAVAGRSLTVLVERLRALPGEDSTVVASAVRSAQALLAALPVIPAAEPEAEPQRDAPAKSAVTDRTRQGAEDGRATSGKGSGGDRTESPDKPGTDTDKGAAKGKGSEKGGGNGGGHGKGSAGGKR